MGKRVGIKQGRPTQNLQGMTFDLLRVISFEEMRGTDGNQHAYWRCLCKCGRENVVRGSALTSGKAKSCGCYRSTSIRQYNTGRRNPDPWLAEMNVYVYHVGWDQRKRGSAHKTWQLTRDEFVSLATGNCRYCGREPSGNPQTRLLRNMGVKKNGIDRLDNTLGYEPGNCVTACGDCNRQKCTMTLSEFIENTRKRYEHLKATGFL